MAARLRLAATLVAAAALGGCAYGATRPPSDVGFTAATLEGTVGDTTSDFQGTWWFEYAHNAENIRHATPHLPFSVDGNTQEPVSSRVSGLDQLGDPVDGTERVHLLRYTTCVEGQSPPYGPICSHPRSMLTGDYVLGSLGINSQFGGGLGGVDVESGVDGEDPQGRVSIDFFGDDGHDVSGEPTCLAVRGTFAAMAVDNELGADVLLRVFTIVERQQRFTFTQVLPPPSDPAVCPDPEAISGQTYGIVGASPAYGDGP
jgi:hypothetical protein